MGTAPNSLVSSHKAAANRASTWLRAQFKFELKPTQACELVARVFGVANWQTLQGLALKGQGPRLAADQLTSPSLLEGAATVRGLTTQEIQADFERAFACGHAVTDRVNFTKHDGEYVQERIATLYEGFVKGRKSLGSPVETGITLERGAASSRPYDPFLHSDPESTADRIVQLMRDPDSLYRNYSAPESDTPSVALRHSFKAGDAIEVENGREEMLYRGKVLRVEGNKVHVSLPAASNRPFIFDLSSPDIAVEGITVFTAW